MIFNITYSYFKSHGSIFNNTSLDKPAVTFNTFKPKKQFFQKFSKETLFYIFYYMPKDSLQIFAAGELYKRKWKLCSDNNIWFFKADTSENSNTLSTDNKNKEEYNYFHPQEWKIMKYVFNSVSTLKFVPDTEILNYINQITNPNRG